MVIRLERKIDARRLILIMSFPKSICVLAFSMSVISDIYVVVSGDGLNPTNAASSDKLEGLVTLNSPAVVSNSTEFKVASGDSVLTIDLLSLLPEDQEISVYCRNLLGIFGQRYAATVNCLVPAGRPVKICQNCFSAFASLRDVYVNISSDQVCGEKQSPVLFYLRGLRSSRIAQASFCYPRMCLMITGLVMLLHFSGEIRETRIKPFDILDNVVVLQSRKQH